MKHHKSQECHKKTEGNSHEDKGNSHKDEGNSHQKEGNMNCIYDAEESEENRSGNILTMDDDKISIEN